jgi:signal transduction histidine kinase
VTGAVALSGWAVALALFALMRRRLELVARAEHELRGPATVLGLSLHRLGPREAAALEFQLDRMRMGLADLAAARRGRRAPASLAPVALERAARGALHGWRDALRARGRRATIDWEAGPAPIRADPGRLAQALGNLVANAAEHGDGPVELRGRRVARGVRVEVRNRGRGLKIADAAARDSGGSVRLHADEDEAVAALELPVADDGEPPPAAA